MVDTAFNFQPTLKGKLLTLRPVQRQDFDSLFRVASDPLIWEQHPAHNRYQEAVFKELFEESLQSGGCLVVIDNETNLIIGSSRFFRRDPKQKPVEIGWTYLARSYWGGKYNKEMKLMMLEHAFQFVDEVIFFVGAENIRSQKAMEKLGAARSEKPVDKGGIPHFIYSLSRTVTF